MHVEETFLGDKFRQLRAENERLKAEVDTYRNRLGNATEDYVRAAWGLNSLGASCVSCTVWGKAC